MEVGGGTGIVSEEKQEASAGGGSSSYTYWVREVTEDAAPLPVPRKLTSQDLLCSSESRTSSSTTLGSVWNSAGTWEEKNLNKWATDRMKELLASAGSLKFSGGKAEISEVSKCIGDVSPCNQLVDIFNFASVVLPNFVKAFLVTVRNKKRVGYTYELTLKVKGEWTFGEEKKIVKGHIDIPEFSFGELDDLQMEVRLSEEKDLLHKDKLRINQDLKLFLQPVREKLIQFEEELKDR